ncbi:hypothetical protein [Staphylococcus xylosus]|uniref:hypothetical protein n=1 Tax=Staphylococcus xylosus TaxID=1288 RepID=UPI001F2E2330|nr:hypothetical protein [Staphylococcus xylosus]MCE7779225.1 hypothetical protein [Staphylococcus xylosus]
MVIHLRLQAESVPEEIESQFEVLNKKKHSDELDHLSAIFMGFMSQYLLILFKPRN